MSEYGKQLLEKQQLRAIYAINERQFRNYVKNILKQQKTRNIQDAASEFLWALERRLDNVVYRMGFAPSRSVARQLVSHGLFSVNGKRVTVPSYRVRISDAVQFNCANLNKAIYRNISGNLKQYKPSPWLQVDSDKMEGKVVSLPHIEDVGDTSNLQMIFEYYAR